MNGARILVVDDIPDAAESLALLLRVEGHEVRTAHDGPNALEVVGAFRPEVALLDIGLPRMDGYELARRLRGVPGLEATLLVALTGYGQEEDRRKSMEAGFDGHLVKPADPAALRALPGIGDYTSAAVAAIAFNRQSAVMDGNVERVISRLYAIDAPLPGSKPTMKAKVVELTPSDRPGDFAQAMMDLGATICTPRRPRCWTRRRRGRCATPSRSGRSTRSSWSTARPSCSRR